MSTTDMSSETTGSRPADDAGTAAGGGEAKAAVKREIDDARDRLSGAAQGLRDEASNAGANLSGMVSDQAERRKDEAADGLRAFSSAVRRAADDLGERDASVAARLAREAAHGLERLSDSLQARSVADMSRSVSDFGRQNPAAFLTGCLLAGVAIGRVLVASGDRAVGNDARYGGDDDWREGVGGPDYAASRDYADRSEFGAGDGGFDDSRLDPLRPSPAFPPSAVTRPDPMTSAREPSGAGQRGFEEGSTRGSGIGSGMGSGMGSGIGGRDGDL